MIESRPSRRSLSRNRNDAPSKAQAGPAIAAAEPQIVPPSTIAPCEIIITAAFMRPRAPLGIARCAATQSSEADNVHPTPASAVFRELEVLGDCRPVRDVEITASGSKAQRSDFFMVRAGAGVYAADRV